MWQLYGQYTTQSLQVESNIKATTASDRRVSVIKAAMLDWRQAVCFLMSGASAAAVDCSQSSKYAIVYYENDLLLVDDSSLGRQGGRLQ
jgi:hypothetical protein